MDTSFTFVTALTPAASKIHDASKYNATKDNVKPSNLRLNRKNKEIVSVAGKFSNDHSISSKAADDSIPSIKSCSDSLHFSSDRSFSDIDSEVKYSNSKESGTESDDSSKENRSQFRKVVETVYAGLEKITFRKKRTNDIPIGSPNYLGQLNGARGTDNVGVCDNQRNKSPEVVLIRKLSSDLNNLNIAKKNSWITDKVCSRKLFNADSTRCSVSSSDNLDNVGNKAHMWREKSEEPSSVNSKNTSDRQGFRISDFSAINSEDISPILRESIRPLTNIYNTDNFKKSFLKFLEDYHKGAEAEKSCESKTTEGEPAKPVIVVKTRKPKVAARKKVTKKDKPDENECYENTEIKDKANEKQVVPKPKRGRKKKDSFIVSDTSSIENQSMLIYHKLLSQDIRVDIKKVMTPRSKFVNDHITDDGIFTPYILGGKRSSSDDSSSEEEMETKRRINTKKTRLSNSEDSDDYDFIKSKKSPVSSGSHSTNSENEQPNIPDNKAKSKSVPKKKVIRSFSPSCTPEQKVTKKKKTIKAVNSEKRSAKKTPSARKLKNIDESSSDSTDSERVNRSFSPNFTPIGKVKEKKPVTPITFKLNNLKKLTPAPDPRRVKEKENALSFLRSLSTLTSPGMVHPDAVPYRKTFKKLREDLVKKLFVLFNREVFDNKLPEDMKIEWNARMRSSSGLCYNKRIKTIITANKECLRVSRIALSTKIIETPERLRDTLIHEMCHAAAWIIDNKADGHGPCWKTWANRAMRTFPELPPIKRCHDYAVQTKFKYKCVNCGYTIGRHSKSLNIERKRCGYCYGKFELMLNKEYIKSTSSVAGISPKNVKVRPLSKFALFVKENYAKVKTENLGMKHAEIMKVLSKNFAEAKTMIP